jgi:hypothetical protein
MMSRWLLPHWTRSTWFNPYSQFFLTHWLWFRIFLTPPQTVPSRSCYIQPFNTYPDIDWLDLGLNLWIIAAVLLVEQLVCSFAVPLLSERRLGSRGIPKFSIQLRSWLSDYLCSLKRYFPSWGKLETPKPCCVSCSVFQSSHRAHTCMMHLTLFTFSVFTVMHWTYLWFIQFLPTSVLSWIYLHLDTIRVAWGTST